MDILSKWDNRFLDLAEHVSSWSKDPSTKVGAVIANGKFLTSVGYNGFPPPIVDEKELLEDRNSKYSMTVHAEMNAIFNAGERLQGQTLYVYPLFPCPNCAKHIVASGIKKVVAYINFNSNSPFLDTFKETEMIFNRAGIETIWVHD